MYDFCESLYIGKSDRFSTGILGGGVAKTIMTGGESAVIFMEEHQNEYNKTRSDGHIRWNIRDEE